MDDRDRRTIPPADTTTAGDAVDPVREPEPPFEERSLSEDIGLKAVRDANLGGPGLTTMEDPEDVPIR